MSREAGVNRWNLEEEIGINKGKNKY